MRGGALCRYEKGREMCQNLGIKLTTRALARPLKFSSSRKMKKGRRARSRGRGELVFVGRLDAWEQKARQEFVAREDDGVAVARALVGVGVDDDDRRVAERRVLANAGQQRVEGG